MTKLFATIRHHSIASARVIEVSENLTQAKKQVSKEFGDEFNFYDIIIFDQMRNEVSSRRVGGRKWHDAI